MKKIPRMVPMAEIMKKLANMKKLMVAIRSGANLTLGYPTLPSSCPLSAGATGKRRRDSSVSFAPAASRDRGRGSLSFQPRREVLLQICCRCSHWQQSVQFMIAGPWSRRIAEDRVLDLVAGRDAEACRGAAVQFDHRTNRRGSGNHIERLRLGALADVDDPAVRIDEQHIERDEGVA